MTSRVHWTCPGCQKTYAVPDDTGLTLCPLCRSRTKPKRFPGKLSAAVLGLVVVFGLAWWMASRTNLMTPVSRVVFGNPEKRLIATWLRENLNDGKWEEVRWWPAVDVGPHLKAERIKLKAILKPLQDEEAMLEKTYAQLQKERDAPDFVKWTPEVIRDFNKRQAELNLRLSVVDRDIKLSAIPYFLKQLELVSPTAKVARIRVRSKSGFGGNVLSDKVFLIDGGKIMYHSEFRSMPTKEVELVSGLREPLGFLE